MDKLHWQSAAEIARLIRARKISALDVLEHFLARVDRFNPALNAIVWQDRERARKRAREADAALAKGEVWGALHGVPMTIKESYTVAGSPTTWGDPALKDNVTGTSALAVERLERAGVVLFGKTNVPLMLADWQSHNAVYGTTRTDHPTMFIRRYGNGRVYVSSPSVLSRKKTSVAPARRAASRCSSRRMRIRSPGFMLGSAVPFEPSVQTR